MSFKFDPINQTVIEDKEPTRLKRLMNKKIAPVHPLIVFPVMAVVLVVGLSINWHNYQNEMKELQRTQSAKHQTKQGV
jgi:predicted negative regulator of RcsB-dependent stress response